MRVSVIVVSYNTSAHLCECLRSLEGQEGVTEVIVVDNASVDGSPAVVRASFPWVRLIENTANRGYGAANNQGMEAAVGDLILLLNSDCIAQNGSVAKLAACFKDRSVAAAGGRLIDSTGATQNSCCSELTLWRVFCEQFLLEKLFPRSRFLNSYWLTQRLIARGPGPFEVDQIMGACLMMRPGPRFDESFFLYCEDTDLCLRIRDRGRILYVDAPFQHALGASTTRNRGWAIAMYNRGKELFFAKHHGRLQSAICWWLNRCGGMLRLLIGMVTFNSTRIATFDKVVFAPLRGPALPADAKKRP